MYESPLQVDDPLATYRVHCSRCWRNVWAGHDVPPAPGEDILAEHICPEDQPQQGAKPRATAKKPRAKGRTDQSARDLLDTPPGSHGHPAQPGPPLG